MSNERKNAPVWVRMETHQKVKAVAKVRRWKLNEAIDAVFDEYLQRHRIDPRQQKHPAA